MTHEERDILKLSEEQANLLDGNVMDAFYTKAQKMIKAGSGAFNEDDIIVYMLAKKYILHEKKNIDINTMSEEMQDLSEDVKKSFNEVYKEYKDIKHKYSKMTNSIDKADVVEAHKRMSDGLHNILDYIEDLFRDLYSCSECEEERNELRKSIKNLAIEYKIINKE